ncbi:MAG: amidophosphoribosyltransferase [Prevotella sp.]|nr:amidophosphoribosyltransferase [Prevotella sp.]
MEQLKHECGVAMIRLKKPLEHYRQKYGTQFYGLNKLYLMMEKQHNRGQEGAGIACVKLDTEPGNEYMFRERAEGSGAITEIFSKVDQKFVGELYMGHLRYSTTGKSGISYVHPFLRRNNWKAKNLCLCGNFNMTNVDELFEKITAQGQCPRIYSDTYIMLEWMGHRLDREVERLFLEATSDGLQGRDITDYIDKNVNVANVLRTAMPDYDGGYVICGLTGSGEMFSMRDPWGIRPAFYYEDDEVMALASERPVLQTTFDIECDDIKELLPGEALIVKRDGASRIERILEQRGDKACSFERIYFSRGNDRDIYQERKKLGEQLTPSILRAIDNDVDHTVFSFIPNTAEVAYYGMLSGFKQYLNERKIARIEALGHIPTHEELEAILSDYVRSEKAAWKDIKLRTFITEGNSRNDLASHVYDITYEAVEKGVDNLVVIDDSIVRGTTLRESIFKILDRLHPKKIVMVSSSPQIRYPDYYGIDMAHLEEFIAFRACIELLKEKGMHHLIDDTYRQCKEELRKAKTEMTCPVKNLYKPFTVEELNRKMVEMLRPEGMQTPIELVFQSIEGLHEACPNHKGDWYFTGDYPTPGGVKLCNRAFVNYIEKVYQYESKF